MSSQSGLEQTPHPEITPQGIENLVAQLPHEFDGNLQPGLTQWQQMHVVEAPSKVDFPIAIDAESPSKSLVRVPFYIVGHAESDADEVTSLLLARPSATYSPPETIGGDNLSYSVPNVAGSHGYDNRFYFAYMPSTRVGRWLSRTNVRAMTAMVMGDVSKPTPGLMTVSPRLISKAPSLTPELIKQYHVGDTLADLARDFDLQPAGH